ncbi:uncharacterized protein PGTG_02818 [Puccinia graminis f. sp. tritici CRL 75-36-700-3]|uniref:Uncharacterized protein n=1 Tax=Puccinia graminis f. sp. tritici (strain CRL 75-36-700-3 / race SCCL) TaxID=418459 RepID=E3JWF2_PUCGT|nr:uncharacterized protein PGTG_02818 [Puccinia graminis f. sp. tritici CRL 75-36-700-3]EFP76377.1 hypothetical protein PGTG_02818 [Puccinia graminis f. sp. tritici CRL 75-36-700-3]
MSVVYIGLGQFMGEVDGKADITGANQSLDWTLVCRIILGFHLMLDLINHGGHLRVVVVVYPASRHNRGQVPIAWIGWKIAGEHLALIFNSWVGKDGPRNFPLDDMIVKLGGFFFNVTVKVLCNGFRINTS